MAAIENLRPAQPGNALAEKHGAYAKLRLTPRATEIAVELREVVPAYAPSDEPTIQSLAMVLAQLERAHVVLAHEQVHEHDRITGGKSSTSGQKQNLARLAQDARGWASVALRYFDALALSPTARGRLGLDIARTQATRLTVTRLAQMAEGGE